MPSKKATTESDRATPSAGIVQQQQQQQNQPSEVERAGDSTNGLSGRGAGSVLAYLIEQEKIRTRKPESN